jgi:hypothetical protein
VYVLTQRSTLRTMVLILLALPIILVGPSRLYLGQHWLSNVLGGYAVSVMLLIPYCWAYTKWRLTATRRRFTGGPTPHDRTLAHPQSPQDRQANKALARWRLMWSTPRSWKHARSCACNARPAPRQ